MPSTENGTMLEREHSRTPLALALLASFFLAAPAAALQKSGGKDTTVSWSDATAVTGGQLKDGETVEVRSVDKNGAHMATAIKIEPAKPAKSATK